MNSPKENRKLKLWELDRVTPEEFSDQKKFPIVVVLDNIRSLNNIGSFFRTCDAFNVQHLFLCGITAVPPHRDINKTAIGATESVSWSHEASLEELIKKLRMEGYVICAIEQTEKTELLQNVGTWKEEKFALIFGNEVDGVDQKVVDASDHVIEIPQFGTKHSLNVSVCAGVVLWEFAKKFIVY
jgi:23S rRNA (guanosine2251-2'-O)-methyltransferase